jgi:hypothetical protein
VESDRGSDLSFSQVLSDSLKNIVQVLLAIQIFYFVHFEMNLIILFGIVVRKIVLFWDLVVNLPPHHQASFISPASGYVLNGIAASS